MTAVPMFDMLTLGVSDLRAARAFYVVKLGFAVEHEGADFLVLVTGATKLLLHARDEAVPPGDLILQIRVEDVARTHADLGRRGVSFWRPPTVVSHEGDPWSPRLEARLRDPDGREIALFSPVRKP